ncbi:major facilitator superfamily domain-containing protein [Phyllosticta capitalensis]|uniref:Major facilitator superfamily domain-containing protein n=1 Tax=Phyllosticta capitalensis TaxID=121624 RepID=A0ABR1YIH1_9PEZI
MVHLYTLHELDQTEGTVQLQQTSTVGKETELVLFPRPSKTDPNDPLRWSRVQKHVCFFAVCSFTFFTNYAIGGLAPAFALLSKEFGKSMNETSDLLKWPVLVLGLFNFFWVPLANYFGKRPVFVFASLLLCVCYIWGAFAQSFKSLLWSNIVAAFAGSTTEALGAAMVNDLYFLHERSSKMAIYMAAISGGNTIGPLICGFIAETIGWRWHKGIAAIAVGINFLLVVFFVPETSYDRDSPGTLSPSSSTEKEIAKEDVLTATVSRKTAIRASQPPMVLHDQMPRKTYSQSLKLFAAPRPQESLLYLFARPFPLCAYPAVIYAFLAYAVSLALTVAINILSSYVLSAEPYTFSPALIGLVNIPGLLGNLVGAFVGGWCVDRYSAWRSKRAAGVFRPETRLPLLVVPAVLVPVGCLLWGYGVQRAWHWVALFWGYGLISVGLTAATAPTMVYVSECYFPVQMDALLLVNGLKNIVAFGFLYGVVPWVDGMGYIDCFGTQAGIYVAILLLGVPLYFYGERIRHATAKWRIIL